MWIHIPTFILWVCMNAAFHMSICRCRWILYWHQKGYEHILSTCYFAFQIYSEIILSFHSIPLIAFSHNWFGEQVTWMYPLYDGIALLHVIYTIIHYIIWLFFSFCFIRLSGHSLFERHIHKSLCILFFNVKVLFPLNLMVLQRNWLLNIQNAFIILIKIVLIWAFLWSAMYWMLAWLGLTAHTQWVYHRANVFDHPFSLLLVDFHISDPNEDSVAQWL